MTKKLIRPLISCLLIIALLVPAVAQAMPAAPAGLSNGPAETLRDYAVPASSQPTGANGADNGSPADSAAPNEPVGRLLLSPAIDADGDPLTNPVGSVPVQRVGGDDPSQDVLYAEVSLAVEVLPDDPQRNPAGTIVTFRIWHESDPVELVREARADAWGAVTTQILFDDLHLAGRWLYQASAPGFGQTPVRSLTFDTARYVQELRLGAARVTTEVEASGRLMVDIASNVAIDEGLSAVELLVFKQVIGKDGAPQRQMLPAMVARHVDERNARAALFLDGGDYLLTALVHSGNVVAQSQPLAVTLDAAAPPAIGSIVAIYEPDASGETVLAHYRTPDGDAALVRRRVADLPPPADPVEPPVFEQTRRAGAFQWQVETYTLDVQVNADDGKKRAYLDGFSWDPLSRSYDIVIESLMDAPVEDKLTVQVYGPGNVVIHEETVPILLDPARPLRHTVAVPADLGEPQGLRIVVHDPLDMTVSSESSGFVWFAEKIETAVDTSFSYLQSLLPAEVDITGSFKGSLTLLGIELATWTQMCELQVCPPMSTGGLFFQPGDWVTIVTDGVRNYVRDNFNTDDIDEAVKRLKTGLPLGTGSGTAILGLRYTRSLYRGRCHEPGAWEAARNMAVAVGRNVKDTAARLNYRFADLSTALQRDPWEAVPIPGVFFLSLQFAPILTFGVEGDYQAPVSVWGEFNGTLGIQLTLLLASGGSYLSLVGKAWSYYDKLNLLWQTLDGLIAAKDLALLAYRAHQFKAYCPDPLPNGNPDDRRDAFQNQFVPEPSGAEGQVTYAARQLQTAQQLGLSRAETYWNLRLRQAEQAAFNLDPTLVVSETLEQSAIVVESQLHVQGLLDGAILPEPGQTITDAMKSLYNDFFVQMENTSILRRQRELRDAMDFAQRQYNLLRGQELALQQELRAQLGQAGLGVLDSGLVTWALTAMGSLGVQAAPVQIVAGVSSSGLRDSRYYTPFEAPSVLLVPSGGFNRYGASQEARDWLDTYVNLGGTLLVLAQADSADWDLLPGGQVEGLGYNQDILCKTASVRIVNGSSWIKGIGRDLPDIQIDGSFTAWPADATVVLMRTTGNQMPAMIEYDYGAGHVVAMSAYPDFYINGMQSVEDIVFARSLFGLAYLHATGQSVAAIAAAPGAPLTLSVAVTNNMALDADKLTLMRDYYASRSGESWRWSAHRPRPLEGTTVVPLTPNLPTGASSVVPVSFNAPPRAGIFRTGMFLSVPPVGIYAYSAWGHSGSMSGPFYEVQTTYTPPPGFSLRASRDRFDFGEMATITATVHNNLATPRTLILTPTIGLDDGPVTLNVPALGTVQHVYTTRVYQRREVRIEMSEGGVPLSILPLNLRLVPPFLGIETSTDQVPAGLATSVTVTATVVDGRASQVDWEARSSTGALVDSATTALALS
ncbi:MAG TPA: hypothetical protein VL334_15475, partial [Anaerolineae bacterium]|nr:hypothetical protein [Anaerolineae bacterium]